MIYIKSIIDIECDKLPKESYLRKIPWVKNFQRIDFEKAVTFFVGDNGTGKSTLLEAIAVEVLKTFVFLQEILTLNLVM